jgi:hypothetical protein
MRIWSSCAWALAAVLSAVVLSAKPASAQTGIYALFTGANLDTTTSTAIQIFGPTLGFYADLPTPGVQVGGDIRGELLNGSSQQHYNGVIGPRVAVTLPFINLKPYGEYLFGFGSYKTTTPDATLHVDYEYIVGVDRRLLSRLDWRILEFSYCNFYNGAIPTKGFSTGLVLRVP